MSLTDHAPATAFRGRTVGEIAATLPGATAVFRRHRLDFCCGGDVPLAEAAARRGAPLDEIEAALDEIEAGLAGLEPDEVPAAAIETGALIDHILVCYHEAHRRDLPELILLAQKVERVHAGNPALPVGLTDLLRETAGLLEMHMKKEELILFPAMRRSASAMVAQPVRVMREEHDDHGEQIRRLEAMTGGFTPPSGACRSWTALYLGLGHFVAELMDHIHLENNVLFPRFDAEG
ncbi:iron-sulfur cluster repair di-iron protein (plasmid) [Tistrella mobilis]|uniref:iron-sulfur cluster repair di-iron protein n=1 Tax=Tistrella mobilis TaxID=171437 RepID=UPI00355863B0